MAIAAIFFQVKLFHPLKGSADKRLLVGLSGGGGKGMARLKAASWLRSSVVSFPARPLGPVSQDSVPHIVLARVASTRTRAQSSATPLAQVGLTEY